MELLKSFFLDTGFSVPEAEQISSAFIRKDFKKGEWFVEEGKTSRHLGFIENGFFQYYITVEGEEKTTYSIGANNFIASLISFLQQVPARENIRAVVNSSLWLITKDAFTSLQKSIPAFKDYY